MTKIKDIYMLKFAYDLDVHKRPPVKIHPVASMAIDEITGALYDGKRFAEISRSGDLCTFSATYPRRFGVEELKAISIDVLTVLNFIGLKSDVHLSYVNRTYLISNAPSRITLDVNLKDGVLPV